MEWGKLLENLELPEHLDVEVLKHHMENMAKKQHENNVLISLMSQVKNGVIRH